MTTRIFQALTAMQWAIDPAWLPLLSALAQRNTSAEEVKAADGWTKRDFEAMAGPGAQRLAGSDRSYVVDGVAVIPITGPIFPRANMLTQMSGATSISGLQRDYSAALENNDVGAIMLLIDSPGGTVSGINAFAESLAAGSKKKFTSAYVAGGASSAAYWIASAASEIALDSTGHVGSIGVVAAISKQVEPDSDGYISVEIVSSNAPEKRPDPTTEDGVNSVRSMLDAMEAEFLSAVAKGRKTTVAKVKSDFKRGGSAVGKEAVTLGMADRVESQSVTMNSLRKMVANQRRAAALAR
jgi:ClpP class serine protease